MENTFILTFKFAGSVVRVSSRKLYCIAEAKILSADSALAAAIWIVFYGAKAADAAAATPRGQILFRHRNTRNRKFVSN